MRVSMLLMAVLLIGFGCGRRAEETDETATTNAQSGNITIPEALINDANSDPGEVLIDINGKTLTRGEAEHQIEMRLGGPPPADMPAGRRKKIYARAMSHVLGQFVKRTLLLEEADRLGIEATEAEIAKGIATLKENTPDGKPPRGSMEGVSREESLRNEVITGIRIDKLLANVLPPTEPPTDAEIDTFIEQHESRLKHPEEGLIMPREQIAELMQRQERSKALSEHLFELLDKADVKHASSVQLPKRYEP